MKIGLVTMQKSYNSYGASLQAYATYQILLNMGHEVKIIDIARTNSLFFIPSNRYPTSFQHCYYKSIPFKILNIFKNNKLIRRFNRFNKRCSYTRYYVCHDKLYQKPPIFDIYLAGSDQVWNPLLDINIEPFLLTFAPENAKRVSYASSIGLDYMPSQFQDVFIRGINQFQHLSVREQKAKEVIKELTEREDIVVVLDPTFLITGDKWRNIAKFPPLSDYVLCFCLGNDETKLDIATNLAAKLKKQLVVIGQIVKGYNATFVNDAGPEEWLGWMANADYIFTDSFHGTAFAIIFRKSFISYISSRQKASRITDLLYRFNLDKCLYQGELAINTIDYNNGIENRIEQEIKISKDFLKKALLSI